ncbi:MAG: thioredoxin [Planctomycetota bacterium]
MGDQTKHFDESSFKSDVLEASGVAVVDFWAEWCPPCKALGPTIDELATEYDGKALIGKVDVDQHSAIGSEYGIQSIPTILYFKDGELVHQDVGLVPRDRIQGKIDELLGA